MADEGRLVEAQYLLQDAGVGGEVYPPLRAELSGDGLLMPLDRPVGPEEAAEMARRGILPERPLVTGAEEDLSGEVVRTAGFDRENAARAARQRVDDLMAQGRYVDAQDVLDYYGVSGQVHLPLDIEQAGSGPSAPLVQPSEISPAERAILDRAFEREMSSTVPISDDRPALLSEEELRQRDLDRALGIEPAAPPVSLPEEDVADLVPPAPVASVGALAPSLLGGAISQMIDEGRIPAEPPPPDERLGLKAAAQIPEDQLDDAVRALTTGTLGDFVAGDRPTAGASANRSIAKRLPELAGIDDLDDRRRQMSEALVELQRRQEAASLSDAPTPDSAEAVKLGDYTVKKGDYISKLAKGSGTTTKAIVAANRDVLFPGGKARQYKKGEKVLLSGQDLIFPGDVLRIPTGEGAETGGPAGDVDPRKDAPKGALAELLEKQGEKAKTIEGLRSSLDELQSTQPDKPVNPFQKFGRDIAYLPSLRAVAFAVNRAEQGDFSMINQMAGRVVKNYELEGLFADYSGFVSGTKRKASEIYMDRALEAQQAELAKKQRSVDALSVMAQTQFLDAGYNAEEAKVFGGYFATVHDEDPATARKWMDSLRTMSTERKKAELKRLKYGSGVAPSGGYSTAAGGVRWKPTDIKRQDDIIARSKTRLQKLKTSRRGMEFDDFGDPIDKSKYENSRAYKELSADIVAEEDALNRELSIYDNMLSGRGRYYTEEEVVKGSPGFRGGDPVGWAKVNETVLTKAAEAAESGEWDTFERELADSKAGVSEAEALQIRGHFEWQHNRPLEEETPAVDPEEIRREIDALKKRPTTSAAQEKARGKELRRLRRGLSDAEVFKFDEGAEESSGVAPLGRRYTEAVDRAEQALLGNLDKGDTKGKILSDLKSVFGDYKDTRGVQSPEDYPVAGYFYVRRGIPISQDKKNLRFLIKKLSEE